MASTHQEPAVAEKLEEKKETAPDATVKGASPAKDVTHDVKLLAVPGGHAAKAGGDREKSKEKSKSPVKDMPASSGSSQEKDVKSVLVVEKSATVDAKVAASDKPKNGEESTPDDAAKGAGIVQSTVEAVKNFAEKVVDKVHDVFLPAASGDAETSKDGDQKEKLADAKTDAEKPKADEKDAPKAEKKEEKVKKAPAVKKPVAAKAAPAKAAAPSKDKPVEVAVEASKDVEMTDASKETAGDAEKGDSDAEVKPKAGRGRKPNGPKAAKVHTPPESLRRSSRHSTVAAVGGGAAPKKEAAAPAKPAAGSKRAASPAEIKGAKKAAPPPVAANGTGRGRAGRK